MSRPASDGIVSLMQRYASTNNIDATRAGFVTGGKTGTAQVPKADGGYREDVFNATFAGFVGTERPEYTVIIRLDEGPAAGNNFTGGKSARPVFTALANQLMDSVSLAPRVP